ncbi:MAG: cadmium resistance transporter, partial [Flammeovirgaceae bacterium]
MEIIVTSILTFVSTNIDDIFILIILFANQKIGNKTLVWGQLTGILALVAISLGASEVGMLVGKEYVGWLGLIPIYLGVGAGWSLFKKHTDEQPNTLDSETNVRNQLLAVAGVTIANGGDNIGVYTPLFASISWASKFAMMVIFVAMTFVWCALAKYLVTHRYIANKIDRYGHLVMPFVLILLGVY